MCWIPQLPHLGLDAGVLTSSRGMLHTLNGKFRICPGRLIAMDSLYIIIASVLHLFNISPGMDDKGQLLSVEIKTTSGLLVYVFLINSYSCKNIEGYY